MAVFATGQIGTIGGGQLEWDATQRARAALAGGSFQARFRVPLGPALGQCCGGVVWLRMRRIDLQDLQALREVMQTERSPVAVVGAGHVGKALVGALAALPFAVTWVDSRDDAWPGGAPPGVCTEWSQPVDRAVAGFASDSAVVILSFSHQEDFQVLEACLRRQKERSDLRWVGLIGSASKWAQFRRRLAQRGWTEAEWAPVVCPIGLPGIRGKEPAVIAASVAAQLLMVFDR